MEKKLVPQSISKEKLQKLEAQATSYSSTRGSESP